MKFNLDRPATTHIVRSYTPGLICIGDRDFSDSVIVTASALIERWRPRRMAELAAVDLEPVLALQPEVLLIGSGERQVFPAP